MSQTDLIVSDQTGASFLADINAHIAALASQHYGPSVPPTLLAGMLWVDTSGARPILTFYSGAQFIPIVEFDDGLGSALPLGLLSALNGQCRLIYDAGSLRLVRHNGARLIIGGSSRAIPQSGVAISASGLTPNTTYYIYAYMSGSTMLLEASTTAYSIDANTGVPVKTGDASRSLVGLARCVAGPAWVDSAAQRFVLSWYNRQPIAAANGIAADVGLGPAAITELSVGARAEFLAWSGSLLELSANGWAFNSASTHSITMGIGIDGIAPINGLQSSIRPEANGQRFGLAIATQSLAVAEGYHYATLWGQTDKATATYAGGQTTLSARLLG